MVAHDIERYVWDYRTGDVVDVMTGEVVDRIYVSYRFFNYDEELLKRAMCARNPRLRSETRAFLRKNHVKHTEQSESKSKEDVLSDVPYYIKSIIDNVISKYPRLKSRSARGKAAVAYILYFIAKYSTVSATHKRVIARVCKLSRNYIDSLIKQIKKLPYIDSIIREVELLVD